MNNVRRSGIGQADRKPLSRPKSSLHGVSEISIDKRSAGTPALAGLNGSSPDDDREWGLRQKHIRRSMVPSKNATITHHSSELTGPITELEVSGVSLVCRSSSVHDST
jgi:hypothetical protein